MKFSTAILSFSFIALVLFAVTFTSTSAAAYYPKSLQHNLFDRTEFVKYRRAARADRLNKTIHYVPASSSSSSSQSSSSSEPIETTTGELRVEDLSLSERDALRRQLRVKACPERALASYRILCEKLLRKLMPRQVRQGITSDKVPN